MYFCSIFTIQTLPLDPSHALCMFQVDEQHHVGSNHVVSAAPSPSGHCSLTLHLPCACCKQTNSIMVVPIMLFLQHPHHLDTSHALCMLQADKQRRFGSNHVVSAAISPSGHFTCPVHVASRQTASLWFQPCCFCSDITIRTWGHQGPTGLYCKQQQCRWGRRRGAQERCAHVVWQLLYFPHDIGATCRVNTAQGYAYLFGIYEAVSDTTVQTSPTKELDKKNFGSLWRCLCPPSAS